MAERILFPSETQIPLPSPAEDVVRLRRKVNVVALGDGCIGVYASVLDDGFINSLMPYVTAIHKELVP